MFKFLKKQKEELCSPVDGTLIAIEDVKDPVFSQKMMGDGFAVKSTGEKIYACADGEVTMVFPTNHAVGLTLANGMELLIHVGIDTVDENGKGFKTYTQQGKHVSKGDLLLEMDRAYLSEKGYDLAVIVVFTNKDAYKEFQANTEDKMIGGKTTAVTYN